MYYDGELTGTVISVRIPKELKEKLENLNVNVSEIVRGFLEKYVEEVEMKRLEERLKRLRIRLAGKVDPTIIAELVREDRAKR